MTDTARRQSARIPCARTLVLSPNLMRVGAPVVLDAANDAAPGLGRAAIAAPAILRVVRR